MAVDVGSNKQIHFVKCSFVCLSFTLRELIRTAISVITEHRPIGTHAIGMGLKFNDYGRSCHEKEVEETVLWQCPRIRYIRGEYLGNPVFRCST